MDAKRITLSEIEKKWISCRRPGFYEAGGINYWE